MAEKELLDKSITKLKSYEEFFEQDTPTRILPSCRCNYAGQASHGAGRDDAIFKTTIVHSTSRGSLVQALAKTE